MASRRAKLEMRLPAFTFMTSPEYGEVPDRFNHCSIADRSYLVRAYMCARAWVHVCEGVSKPGKMRESMQA